MRENFASEKKNTKKHTHKKKKQTNKHILEAEGNHQEIDTM